MDAGEQLFITLPQPESQGEGKKQKVAGMFWGDSLVSFPRISWTNRILRFAPKYALFIGPDHSPEGYWFRAAHKYWPRMNTDERGFDSLSERVLGAAFEVSNPLGAGFLEKCTGALLTELGFRGIRATAESCGSLQNLRSSAFIGG